MSKSDLFIPHVKHMIDQLQKQIAELKSQVASLEEYRALLGEPTHHKVAHKATPKGRPKKVHAKKSDRSASMRLAWARRRREAKKALKEKTPRRGKANSILEVAA
jgi:hypothetical protein